MNYEAFQEIMVDFITSSTNIRMVVTFDSYDWYVSKRL